MRGRFCADQVFDRVGASDVPCFCLFGRRLGARRAFLRRDFFGCRASARFGSGGGVAASASGVEGLGPASICRRSRKVQSARQGPAMMPRWLSLERSVLRGHGPHSGARCRPRSTRGRYGVRLTFDGSPSLVNVILLAADEAGDDPRSRIVIFEVGRAWPSATMLQGSSQVA